MEKAAIISVSDRSNLVGFARSLQELGYKILATSGTVKHLAENGIKSYPIEDYTGQKEILDGRVKTLHPKIHAGLLARRDNPAHMAELGRNEILPIEIVAVNLYPFAARLQKSPKPTFTEMVELVDIGGPTMLRAASKNMDSIYVVSDPEDYDQVIQALGSGSKDEQQQLRIKLAVKVFTLLAQDNLEVARYFSSLSEDSAHADVNGVILLKDQELRYGENSHQQGVLYRSAASPERQWKQLAGKELSYNNLLDLDAAVRIVRGFHGQMPFATIIKHLNPCGAATGRSLLDALSKAKLGDPRSHFGGIIGFNREVDLQVAENIREDFAEIVVAPTFANDALTLLTKNKNLRLISYDFSKSGADTELRSLEVGYLVQQRDLKVSSLEEASLMSERKADESELADLQLAWEICAHVKSNAIVLAKGGMLVGVGAGQMSRIDSVELAISKAKYHGHDLKGAVAASDAFFPFPDALETLAACGVSCVIAPKGAKRDEEIVALAKQLGMTLYFTVDRHFRH